MTLAGARFVVLDMLFPDARVQEADRELSDRIVPFTLLALLVLAVSQLPVAIWLAPASSTLTSPARRWLLPISPTLIYPVPT